MMCKHAIRICLLSTAFTASRCSSHNSALAFALTMTTTRTPLTVTTTTTTTTMTALLPTTTTTTRATTRLHQSTPVPRHDVGESAQMQLPAAVAAQMDAYQQHQQAAAKLDWAADVRTLIQYNHGFAVMSTISKSDPGYPGGSVVGFAVDEQGRPLFIFSGMSTHTQDILANPKCSLTVAAKDFKGAADGRVNLMGTVSRVRDATEIDQARAIYKQKHPGAFWTDFGDFNWFRMEVEKVRFVGGFARAGMISAAEYQGAAPDPISLFGPQIAQHMNEDHMEANIALVKGLVPGMAATTTNGDPTAIPPKITEALITSVDSLGMYIKVTREAPVAFLPVQFKLRLPFPRPATDRKDVRTLIVEMTQEAAAVLAQVEP